MRRLLALVLLLPLTACSDPEQDEKIPLVIFAAASLTTTFEQLEGPFEAAHPELDVRFSFAGSSDLVAQIVEGAEAHVFASADTKNMDVLVDEGFNRGEPVEFATNTLMIAVPPGNPAGVTGLDDLADRDLALVLCAPEVPCGRASREVADAADVDLEPDSEEQSVTDVLAKVEAGEADAGLVYVTDVQAAGDAVEGITFPEATSIVNHYPIVRVEEGGVDQGARQWIDFVLSTEGQKVLSDAGFGPPA